MRVLETKTIHCRGGMVVIKIAETLDDKINISVSEHHYLGHEPVVRIGIEEPGATHYVFLKDIKKP